MKIGFVGGGNMAQALMGGLVARHHDVAFVVIEPHAPTRDTVTRAVRGATLHERPSADLATCDAVIVAVKPQQVREAVADVSAWLAGTLVVSIAAGIRTRDLARWMGAGATPAIVRAMPNTPALIGEGITGLYAMPAVSREQRELADRLLSSVGQTLWLDDESRLDAVTAVSGSGPAYVFSFIEALEQGGLELGLTLGDARRLAIATFVGASRLASESEEPIAVLRERVTSKGGTTHAALAHLNASDCHAAIVAAIHAAARRSVEMGDEFADPDER